MLTAYNIDIKLGGGGSYNPLSECAECTIRESLDRGMVRPDRAPIRFYKVTYKTLERQPFNPTFGICKNHIARTQDPNSKYIWERITREEVEVEMVLKE